MKNQIYATFASGDKTKLGNLCLELLEEQKITWPMLGAAYKGLAEVQTKSLSCNGYKAYIQFNPARSVSSGAAVDQESIKNRPCFLCTDNLPCDQKGILYKNEYLILCNPAPIFEKHFTIVHVHHQPQEITQSVNALLDIARDMSSDFVVFYNGPACGASAPDHLHFQAVPEGAMPLWEIFPDSFQIIENSSVQVYLAEGINRSAITIAGQNKDLLLSQFARLMQAAQKIVKAGDEPMINVLCSYEDCAWRIIIFFRGKHRPDAYYLEGDNRVFVSPGSIDMAGVIISPRKLDFDRLDCEDISRIYDEVSLTEETIKKLTKAFGGE